MSEVTFTRFTSNEPLSKRYWLEAGELKKQAAAQMTSGRAERVTMPFAEFPNAFEAADSKTAFGYGVHPEDLPDAVLITTQGNENKQKATISRTKGWFTYQGAGVLMLDHDPSPYGKMLTPDGLIAALVSIHPAFANAARLIRGSVSAGVHLEGEQPRSDKGFHVYLSVANAADIPRYGKALFDRLWLAGHGFIALSANGSCLVRACIDGSVFSPERLDFVGKPVLTGKGLQYTPPETVYTGGGHLDTATLPDLTDDEAAEAERLITNAKAAMSGQSQAKREEWAGDKVKTMVAAGVPDDKARAIIADMLKGGCKDLYGDYPLQFGNKTVTVNEVLDNAAQYDGKALADPIEGREYGFTTAKFYWNNGGGKQVINSLAHGVETRYFLQRHEADTGSDGEKPLRIATIAELLTYVFPKREPVLAPVFSMASLNMVFSRRGVGKTHVALGIAYAAASGGKLWEWSASRPFKTLYIDGEMPGESLQERLAKIVGANDIEPPSDFFKVITIDMNDGRMPDLSTLGGQVAVELFCQEAELIIIDNLSCLCRSGRENEAESWQGIGEWAMRMRSAGKCVIFIHHAGKDGNQRGTSKREDLLDTVIELKRSADYEPEQGARFIVQFTKARHLIGDEAQSIDVKLETIDGIQVWTTKPIAESNFEQVIELYDLDLNPTEIANELGVHKSTVSRALKKAKAEGRITEKAQGNRR